ncbi:MAG TPA: trypsin-like peptidase domain-containing protein [Polyangia bacterium]|nr:trypsin-like peptidase domain-containing protein [Polyangia bacterium]
MPTPPRLLLASFIFVSAARAATAAEPAPSGRVEASVVKVFSTVRPPDPFKPWTKEPADEISGSGVIIEGRRVLTNAHVVMYASQVQVQANQTGDKVSATVVAIAPGIDLALLKLDDEKVFDTHGPLRRAPDMPDVKDAVMAYGFPAGGSNLSITKGIVSRIEFATYNRPVSGLRIQIDAAINHGNSGGPAVVGDKMIGLAFSTLGGTQNIGYIIPNEEIELFLKDIADGTYDGKPALFEDLQTLENPALRAFLRLPASVQGIVVHEPNTRLGPSLLKAWDVITKIGDTPIDDQGMVQVGANLRIRFQYLVQRIAKNGKVPLTVVRAGKSLTLQIPVSPQFPMLIPDKPGEYPPYFIYGPLVFSAATSNLLGGLREFGGNGVFSSPLVTRMLAPPAFPGEELVVVPSPFLPHKLVQGYGNPAGEVIKSVNGIAIKNLRHLVEVLRDNRQEFLTFEGAQHGGETYVFARKELEAATEDILNDNGIRSQGSPDLLKVWSARAK